MAQSENIFVKSWKWFVGRHKLHIDRTDNSTDETWFVIIRPWQVLMGIAALLMLLMGAAIGVVAYTPILDMIPGTPGEKSRNLLIENIVRLDSLEREMNNLLVYSDNISLIVDGKTPIVRNVEMVGDSIDIKSKEMISTSAADSALRAQIEGTGEYSIAAAAARKNIRTQLDMLPPTQGVVTRKFDPKNGAFGVCLSVEPSATVSAVKDGTIVASYWSPDDGYVITIQHSDNLLSTYKHNTTLQKNVGAHVRAGEVIATVGESTTTEGDKTAEALEVELWYKGTPIDPEGYIVF